MEERSLEAIVELRDRRGRKLKEIRVARGYTVIRAGKEVSAIRQYLGDQACDRVAFLLEVISYEEDKEKGILTPKSITPLEGLYTIYPEYYTFVEPMKDAVEAGVVYRPPSPPLIVKYKREEDISGSATTAWPLSESREKRALYKLGEGEVLVLLLGDAYLETGKVGDIPVVERVVRMIIRAVPRKEPKNLEKELYQQ